MKGLKSREVSDFFGDDDRDGKYKILSLEQRDYDLVACDISLRYKPKRLPVHVPSDDDIPFVLEISEPSNGQSLTFEEPKVTYLKHVDTGCEPPPIKTEGSNKEWTMQINLAPGAFDEQYSFCRERDGNKTGSYETCFQRQVQVGRSREDVEAAIGAPENTDRDIRGTKQIYKYPKEKLKITFLQDPKDKVLKVSLIEATK